MQTKKLITLAVAAIFFLASMGGTVLAKEQGSTQANAPMAKVMKITVIGKIVKDESMGGYYIQGKQPPEIFNIVNQNPKVLEKYAKNGKDVTIEAQSAMGDNLVIEKIEGEKYAEAEMK